MSTATSIGAAVTGLLLVVAVFSALSGNRNVAAVSATAVTTLSSVLDSIQIDGPDGQSFTLSALGNVSVQSPGYSKLPAAFAGSAAPMTITAFPKPSAIYRLNPKASAEAANIETITDKLDWPNELRVLTNASIFGNEAIVVGSGFLVPGHSNGGVDVIVKDSSGGWNEPVRVTEARKGWFYHVAFEYDIDGDGDFDLVTARAYYPTWNFWQKKQGKLVWLENPGLNVNLKQTWQEHEIADGPDFLVTLRSSTGPFELLAPEYIGERLVYHYRDDDGTFKSRVVEQNFGPGFAANWVDVNGDGQEDIFATNHASDGNGKVYAFTYNQADSLASAQITKHVLASGFECRGSATKSGKCATGQASPGEGHVFYPHRDVKRPWILVDGDGQQTTSLLIPTSSDLTDWSYTRKEIGDWGATIGQSSVGDLDQNGYAELYSPALENNQLITFGFSASVPATSLQYQEEPTELQQCVSWRQTGGCDPNGPRESQHDLSCTAAVPAGTSGFCECFDGRKAQASKCGHTGFTCTLACEGRVSEAPASCRAISTAGECLKYNNYECEWSSITGQCGPRDQPAPPRPRPPPSPCTAISTAGECLKYNNYECEWSSITGQCGARDQPAPPPPPPPSSPCTAISTAGECLKYNDFECVWSSITSQCWPR